MICTFTLYVLYIMYKMKQFKVNNGKFFPDLIYLKQLTNIIYLINCFVIQRQLQGHRVSQRTVLAFSLHCHFL